MRALRTEDEIIANWKGDIEQPVVSICCITYNHEPYIEDALEGFLIQETDFPFEILIHDDASTDRTTEIINKYARKYPRIIRMIIQTENQWSKGIRILPALVLPEALGEYVALCDGDDYWVSAEKLQIQVSFLEKNSEYVICYTDCQPFNDVGNYDKDFGGCCRDVTSDELQNGLSLYTLTTCFRNVFKTKKWPPELGCAAYGDLALWSFLGEFGAGKYMSDIKPSMYRVHSAGVHSMRKIETQQIMRLKTFISILNYKFNSKHQLPILILTELVILCVKLGGVKLFKSVILRLLRVKV